MGRNSPSCFAVQFSENGEKYLIIAGPNCIFWTLRYFLGTWKIKLKLLKRQTKLCAVLAKIVQGSGVLRFQIWKIRISKIWKMEKVSPKLIRHKICQTTVSIKKVHKLSRYLEQKYVDISLYIVHLWINHITERGLQNNTYLNKRKAVWLNSINMGPLNNKLLIS